MRLDKDKLSFDLYDRLSCLAEAIETLDPGGAARALDVGGYPCLLADALPGREVWTLDRIPCERERYVQGTGADLPFGDGEFDVVVASDTLEHILPAQRDAFLDQCARVAKGQLVLSGPFDTPGVAWAERTLNDWHARLHGRPQQWLKEHIDCGLPPLAPVAERLRGKGASVRIHPHGDLLEWFLLEFAAIAAPALPGAQPAVEAFSRAYNHHWAGHEARWAAYRHVVVADFSGSNAARSLPWKTVDPERPMDDGVGERLRALAAGMDAVVASLEALSATGKEEGRLPVETAAYIATLEAALRENASIPDRKEGWLGRLKRGWKNEK